MDFRTLIKDYNEAPISRATLLNLLQNYKRPNDKISELINQGYLISLKRGLYSVGQKLDLKLPEPFLIANHLYGPSYVSLESALSFWSLIPERVFGVNSVTLKKSNLFQNEVGRFSYRQAGNPYYSFGIQRTLLSPKQAIVIASPEKALCDKIVFTSGVQLRSEKQTRDFLLEDMRMDEEQLSKFDCDRMALWLAQSPKKCSLEILIKTIQNL